MASCEEKRTKAYANDLRWRMVYQARVQEKTYREIAADLNEDHSTIRRTVALFDETDNVSPREYPSNVGTARLTEMDKLIILELVIEKPCIYLSEIQQELESGTGTVVDVSTICRFCILLVSADKS